MTLGALVSSATSLIGEQTERNTEATLNAELQLIDEQAYANKITELENEVSITLARLDKGIGVADDNRSRLDTLRSELESARSLYSEAVKKRISSSLNSGQSETSANPVAVFAKTIGVEADFFRLLYTGFLTLMLEIGGLATTAAAVGKSKSNRPDKQYLVAGQSCHILQKGSSNKCLCGGTFKGTMTDMPSANVCPECIQSYLKGPSV